LEIPAKTLSKETGSTADRVNVSVRSHLLLQAFFVNAGGADINQMSLSKSTVHHQHKENRVETANRIKENFQVDKVSLKMARFRKFIIYFIILR
jgi:hypothetical protein